MIGHTTATRQPPPPPPLPINQSTCSGDLKNAINGHIIKVKNIPLSLSTFEFETFEFENSLAKQCTAEYLKEISYITSQPIQKDRFTSIGIAVFRRDNSIGNTDAKIPTSRTGEQSPRGTPADMQPNPATLFEIGYEFVKDLENNYHALNYIYYAVAVGTGHGIKQSDPDTTSIEQFGSLSALRKKELQKSNQEGDINLRPAPDKKHEHQPH